MDMKDSHGSRETLDVGFEIKALDDAGEGSFEGYASLWGEVDSYSDIIQKGAYRLTLADHKKKKRAPALLWQHDSREPIGAYTSLSEDDKGLFVQGQLLIDDIPKARQAHALMKAGGLSGMSIGFRARKSKIDEVAKVRTLVEIQLFEISLVTFPALDSARVSGVKAGSTMTVREFETFLRDEGGFSIGAAKAIASGGFRAGETLRDEGELAGLQELRDSLLKNAETFYQS
jgi:HK97 family phage prohead protease